MVDEWRHRTPSFWASSAKLWETKADALRDELEQSSGESSEALVARLRYELAMARAEISRHGGCAPFPNLYRDGRIVNARHVRSHDGKTQWMLYRDDDPTQRGKPRALPDDDEALAQAGYVRQVDLVPAWTNVASPSSTVAGLAPALKASRVEVYRADAGRPLTDQQLAAA